MNLEAGTPHSGAAQLTRERGSPLRGALQISADGRFLLAADAGSNQISVLRIKPGGSLMLVAHGVSSSGGVLPVSIAVHGDLVCVANAGATGSNYTGSRLRPNGRLQLAIGSAGAAHNWSMWHVRGPRRGRMAVIHRRGMPMS